MVIFVAGHSTINKDECHSGILSSRAPNKLSWWSWEGRICVREVICAGKMILATLYTVCHWYRLSVLGK